MAKTQSLVEIVKSLLEKRHEGSTELFPDFRTASTMRITRTRSAILNAVTVVGGFPRGRVNEIFGPESTGKTTIGIESCICAQEDEPELATLFLDFEHAFDASYAHNLGLNLDPEKFIFAQPDCFEQGEDIVMEFLQDKDGKPRNLLSALVIDSAAAMTPLAELQGSGQIGLQALLMSRFLAKLTKSISAGTKPTVIVLNQTRNRIDIRNPRNSGEDSAGGKALKFYTTIRLSLERTHGEGKQNRGDGHTGTDQVYTMHTVRVTAVKNKVAPPWVRGTLVFSFGRGIDNAASILELAEQKLGILGGGGNYQYSGSTPELTCHIRGRDNMIAFLKQSPELLRDMETRVLSSIRESHQKMLGVEIKAGGEAKQINGDAIIIVSDAPQPNVDAEYVDLPVEDV